MSDTAVAMLLLASTERILLVLTILYQINFEQNSTHKASIIQQKEHSQCTP